MELGLNGVGNFVKGKFWSLKGHAFWEKLSAQPAFWILNSLGLWY